MTTTEAEYLIPTTIFIGLEMTTNPKRVQPRISAAVMRKEVLTSF